LDFILAKTRNFSSPVRLIT